MINAGEQKVVREVLRYAAEEGAWFATVEGLIELASSARPAGAEGDPGR